MKAQPRRVIAASFALSAFVVAIMAGLAAGNTAPTILLRAVVVLLACYPLGSIVGMLCERVVAESTASEKSSAGDEEPPVIEQSPAGGGAPEDATVKANEPVATP